MPNIQPFFSESQRRAFAEAKAEGKAEAILKILARREISITEDQRRHILDGNDLAMLDHWLDRALTVTTAGELFE